MEADPAAGGAWWSRRWPERLLVGLLLLGSWVQFLILLEEPAATAVGGPGIAFGPPPYAALDLWAAVLFAVQCLPLLWRRRYPYPVLAVIAVAYLLDDLAGYPPVPANGGLLLALYADGASPPLRATPVPRRALAWSRARINRINRIHPRARGAVTATVLLVGLVYFGLAVALYAAFLFAFWGFGRAGREWRERVLRLERDRATAMRAAAAQERTRLAMELHDIVAHDVGLMTVQASVARQTFDARPEAARDALSSIETTARQSLRELRRLLGVLRTYDEPGSELEPPPTLAQLDALVNQVRRAGLAVDVEALDHPPPLPLAVDQSAYRIVQEALTNVLKHAGPARARVVLRYRGDLLEVEVVDDGQGPLPPGEERVGHGLIGMRERVAVFGGELEAGPRREGGFHVAARFPLQGG